MSSATKPPAGKRYRFVVRSADEAATAIREKLGEKAKVLSVRQIEGEGLARFLRAPKLEIIAYIPAEDEAAEAVPEFHLPEDSDPSSMAAPAGAGAKWIAESRARRSIAAPLAAMMARVAGLGSGSHASSLAPGASPSSLRAVRKPDTSAINHSTSRLAAASTVVPG